MLKAVQNMLDSEGFGTPPVGNQFIAYTVILGVTGQLIF